MTSHPPIRRTAAAVASSVCIAIAVLAAPAGAHSLDSSTISVRVGDDSVDATISVALETIDAALGTDYLDEDDVNAYDDEVIAYLAEHLTVTSADARVWGETFSDAARQSVEGIESFSVVVSFDVADSDTTEFTIAYDAIIEVVTTHEAVVVLTDSNGDISTPGIITGLGDTVDITSTSSDVAISDMIHHGFDHVLLGADHLLFLIALLLPAPLMVTAGRWTRSGDLGATLRKVVHVVTAFTVGHSLTLIASASGWVSAPSRPIEVLIAVSVGVSAIHAIRPLAARGEQLIAFGFGLVHGLAFAGILSDLGLDGSESVTALLGFNVGIELAQLAATALVFPSLAVLSTTRFSDSFRIAGAAIAVSAATGWLLERIGVLASPFTPLEEAAIDHPWRVVFGLAAIGVAACFVDRRGRPAAARRTAGRSTTATNS